jgi:hypothetical protein
VQKPSKLDDFVKLIGSPVVSFVGLGGGRNSRVYGFCTADGETVVGKEYFVHAGNFRPRLQVEFGGLTFLWKNGVRNIPRPIAADYKNNIAVYAHINGQSIVSSCINRSDIDQVVCFLGILKDVGLCPESLSLPQASAACFSVIDVENIIETRLKRLGGFVGQQFVGCELQKFISTSFMPIYRQILEWSKGRPGNSSRWGRQLLSPSDFGFHNAICVEDDQLVFLDFEYFGWDSPVKIISDFILHPGMELSVALKKYFVQKVVEKLCLTEQVVASLKAMYPLFGLVWCLIVLNEFSLGDQQRREFTGRQAGYDDLCVEQLAKAQNLLAKIEEEYEQFPYL